MITTSSQEMIVPCEGLELRGSLAVPEHRVDAVVIFAHGSGSSRKSPRNIYVAERLGEFGLMTFLFDLLTAQEELIDIRTSQLRFDINLLAKRLVEVTQWLKRQPQCSTSSMGYFGASTGAAAALVAASNQNLGIKAIVSRGGRSDLAGEALKNVKAPTLFIVGSQDKQVLGLNQLALRQMQATKINHLEVVSGATHLFEEPGALEKVAELAAIWFSRYLKHKVAVRKLAI